LNYWVDAVWVDQQLKLISIVDQNILNILWHGILDESTMFGQFGLPRFFANRNNRNLSGDWFDMISDD